MRWTYLTVGGELPEPIPCSICKRMIVENDPTGEMDDIAYTPADLTPEQIDWLVKLFHVKRDEVPEMFTVCESCMGGHCGNAERWLDEQIERAGYKLPSDDEDAEDEDG
jgi:hypothetical protein